MFEETNVGALHTDKLRGRLRIVMIQATSDGSALTIDTANTTPGITVSGSGGSYSFAGIPTGAFLQPVGYSTLSAGGTGAGSLGQWTALSATAGTGTIETSGTTVGTAAAPANGDRVFITMLVGRTA